MDRTSIFDTIKDLVTDITDVEDITEQSQLYDDLSIDSVDLAELIFACEEEFDIVIPKEKAARDAMMAEVGALESVGDVVDYIVKCAGELA